jgi:hypothetical protein
VIDTITAFLSRPDSFLKFYRLQAACPGMGMLGEAIPRIKRNLARILVDIYILQIYLAEV